MRRHFGLSRLALRALLACIAVCALGLTSSAAAQEDGLELTPQDQIVEVVVPDRTAIDTLIAEDVDLVEYVRENPDGTLTLNAVVNDEELAALEAAGYQIGATIQDHDTYLARIAERNAALAAERASHEAAENGAVANSAAKQRAGLRSIVFAQAADAPEIVVNRVDYFQNYAGWFLSVEAFDSLVPATGSPSSSGPVVSVAWKTATGDYGAATTIPRYIDSDPNPDTYMYNRVLIRIGNASPPYGTGTPPDDPVMVRIGSSTGFAVEAPVRVWLGGGLPPHSAAYMTGFFDHYMDPTEVYDRFESLATEFPNLSQLITLPEKTAGYQRKSAAIMAPLATTLQGAQPAGATAIRLQSTNGVIAGTVLQIDTGANLELATVASVITPNPPNPNPNVNLTAPLALAHASGAGVIHGAVNIGSSPATAAQGSAVVLTAAKYGQNGGNDTRAAFVNPGVPDSPLSVTVTPNILGEKDVTVSLATDPAGRLSSTAAQVVAALNADPAASAVLSATLWATNVGAGIVQPRSLVNLSDFLDAPASVQRGPFTEKVLRIGRHRDGSRTGVFIFCQQHAREWVTPVTCVETAEELLRNYATDPETKELVDNLDIFILPSANPDGSHYSLYDFDSQRKNMTNYCAPTSTSAMPSGRDSWGVDLNRNSGSYSLYDGYSGASSSCTSEVYAGPSEVSEPETRNLNWVVDTFTNIKFSNNVHTYGGYFMWAPGAYIAAGRVSAPAPNIGIEGYFFAAADTVNQRIKDVRGTTVLPGRTGPIADVLYSAAGNGSDDQWYRNGIVAYAFEAGSDRFTSSSTTTLSVASLVGAASCPDPNATPVPAGCGVRVASTTGLQVGAPITIDTDANAETFTIARIVTGTNPSPNPNVVLSGPLTLVHPAGAPVLSPGTGGTGQSAVGFFPNFATEGRFEALEFAQGNFGLLESALAYQNDHEPPAATTSPEGPAASQNPIEVTFKWVNEPSVIRYTLDGSAPNMSSPQWERQGPRRPGEIFTFDHTTTVRWFATDMVGNTSEIQSARFAVDADAPTTTASLSPPPQNGYYSAPFVSLVADDDYDLGGSGIASTEYKLDGAADWTTYSGPFQVTTNGPHTLEFRSTDLAGNVEDTQSISFTVDSTGPTVTLTTPPDGAVYTLDKKVKASYACSDGESGLVSCVGNVANGAYIATNTVGPKTFTVTGTDMAGNVTTVTHSYDVFWPFDGFEDPLDAKPGKYVEEKAGNDIDVVFSLGGDRGMHILVAGSPYSMKVNCSDYTPAKACSRAKRLKRKLLARQQGESFGSLKYDKKKKRYSFEWETDKSWKGTCRMLVVQLTDGSVHSVVVKFK
jgi:hypothetical protein